MTQLVPSFILLLLSHANCQKEELKATYHTSLASAVADFTQSIYVHLASSDQENFVFSPLSLHSALSLLYLATTKDSTTQTELGAAMGKIKNPDLVKSAYKRMISSYGNQKSFSYGNHIWVANKFDVDPAYKELVSSHFDSEVSNLDFEGTAAVDEVNNWIQMVTNEKIRKLVDSFSADTQMFLASAIYFKDKWVVPFEDLNRDGITLIEREFQTDSQKVKVPMIWKVSEEFIYGEIKTRNGVLEVVTIPYQYQPFEMQIIIPENNKQFNILEDMMKSETKKDKFDGGSFNLFTKPKNESEYKYKEIYLMFPTFQVKSKFNAVEAMTTLGVREVFTSGAELDKLAAGPIAVGNILHEAIVEVTKDGTVAAAATGIGLTLLSSGFRKDIVLDRPFIFIIQDTVNNIPVMVGRIKNPSIKLV